jgi:hypothetical protein
LAKEQLGEKDLIKIKVEGGRLDDLVQFLSIGGSKDGEVCKASIVKEIDHGKVGFFVYEGFYLRVQRTVSGSIFFFQTDSGSCEITIVGSGGASAIGVTWGAQKDVEEKISKAILDCANKLGMKTHCCA